MLVLDLECYPNYFLASFKNLQTGKLNKFDTQKHFKKKQIKAIMELLTNDTIITFNGQTYDIPMINYALRGTSVKELYNQSKSIIENKQTAYQTYRLMRIATPLELDHIDLKEPAPGVGVSLKLYGTRIGSKKLWDLPFDPHKPLTDKEIKTLILYCENDLDVTIDLYNAIKDRIQLREKMNDQYKLDLRSKSDAQIAEAVIISELGGNVPKSDIHSDYTFKYKTPDYLKFQSKELKDLLKFITKHKFELDNGGSPKLPATLKPVTIANTTYKFGIGGLHSQEKSLTVESDDDYVMRNADYASYYPFIILNNKYYPKHLGKKFLKIYRNIVETRLKAKAKGDKLTADSLKITINGSFGKYGSKYSKLYSPDLLLQTTITGQLTLLMLIEKFEANDISVISANTDGIEYLCRRCDIDLAEEIIAKLDEKTGYTMEHGEYQGLYARDVNNYVAKYDGYTKSKGVYADRDKTPGKGLDKNTQVPICFEAVRQFILDGTPIKKTIKKCKDVKQFVSAMRVTGGGEWRGKYLGKVVRWYYSTDGAVITKVGSGNKVPLTDSSKPMMDLTKKIPKDLDYNWYIQYAKRMLGDLNPKYALSDEQIHKKALKKAGSIEQLQIDLGYKRPMKITNASITKMKKYLYG